MSEVGLYALTKVIAGGVSALLTGPLGTMDLPESRIEARLTENISGYTAKIMDVDGNVLGYAGHGRGKSPHPNDLPASFTNALLAIEDFRFGQHPGVDPLAIAAALIDTARGNQRGGSTLTQQLVKNAFLGPDLTLDRKVKEAILSIRLDAAFTPEEIMQSYLANIWFGRGQNGISGASLAWFGKEWSKVDVAEAALIAGMIKGPAFYDPEKHPERAKARRDTVLKAMLDRSFIDQDTYETAVASPIKVISSEESKKLLGSLSFWAEVGLSRELSQAALIDQAQKSQGDVEVVTTISPVWQSMAEKALRSHLGSVVGMGPSGTVDARGIDSKTDPEGKEAEALRAKAAGFVPNSPTIGRAIVISATKSSAKALIDKGYGPLEWADVEISTQDLGYSPKKGDVLAYRREDGKIKLLSVPQAQAAVVVMNPQTGAILASVGGYDADISPFDRTQAMRQPGSSIKPFLWLLALEQGMAHDDLVADVRKTYRTSFGKDWTPNNYNGKQSGLIPLYGALEQSSNLAAASLIDIFGAESFASITETVGVYDFGKMTRHPSASLGVSESTLTRMTSGYSSLVNGGIVVRPHMIDRVEKGDTPIWSSANYETGYAVATTGSTLDVTSMLYGVTQRGTAARPFSGSKVPVAGKTGTSQNYRDAWFISYTPGISIGVWVGRDDFKPLPGSPTGSRAAAPIARMIYDGAVEAGLMNQEGFRPDQTITMDWPPLLLASSGQGRRFSQDMIDYEAYMPFEADPAAPQVFEEPLTIDEQLMVDPETLTSQTSPLREDELLQIIEEVQTKRPRQSSYFDEQDPVGDLFSTDGADDGIFQDF